MRTFALTRHFSVLSLLLMLTAGVLLSISVHRHEINLMEATTQESNAHLTKLFQNLLGEDIQALTRPLATAKSEQSLPESRPLNQLNQKVARLIQGTPIVKLKVYNPQGITLYSTDASQIGEDKSNNAGFLAARHGQVASELTHRNEFSVFEEVKTDINLVSSYIPIIAEGQVVEVFELYQDVTKVIEEIEQSVFRLILLIAATLGSLYLIQRYLVMRVRATLSAQESLLTDKASLMESIVEATDNGILVVDRQARVRFANRKFAKMWQIPDELIAHRDDQKILDHVLVQLADPKAFLRKVEKLYSTPEANSRDTVRFLDGRLFKRYSHPQRCSGEIIGRIWSFLDITDQHQSEQRIIQLSNQMEEEFTRTSRERSELKALLKAIPDLVWMKDSQGAFLSCNPGFASLLGQAPDDVIGKTDQDFFPAEIASTFLEDDQQAMLSPQPVVRKQWLTYQHDGHLGLLEIVKTAVRTAGGELLGVMGIARDITHSHMLMQEVEKARAEAMQANEAKSLFLANMSHEIRTPMNAIVGMSELCLNTTLNDRQRNYVSKIKSASDALLHIINDILDFSKIEAGKLSTETIPFDLESVFEQLTTITALKAENQGIELTYDISQDVATQLIGDPLRLGQVLTNLLTNALKFSKDGDVLVSVVTQATDTTGTELHFSVRDQGIGISAEQLQTLFKPFAQADSSTTRRFGGSGLGLTISQHLVELMGGRMWVESEPGIGSTFHFTTRFDFAPAPVRTGIAELARKLADHADKPILVVDDNPLARRVLTDMIRQLGLPVHTCASGQEAIDRASQPDAPSYLACLVDWRMPDMDGLESIRRLRQTFSATADKVPPMLLVTAYSHNDDLHELDDQVDGMLAKPLSARLIYVELAHCLGVFDAEIGNQLSLRGDKLDWSRFAHADILLVEDIELNREVIHELLAGVGLQLRMVTNGQEALEAVELKAPDLILMDCQMPVMDGFAATGKLRETRQHAALPIIALTANASSDERARCLAAGMNDHVSKPLNMAALHAKMCEHLLQQPAELRPGITAETTATPTELTLPGIDSALGLRQTGGRPASFVRILKLFREDLGQRFPADYAEAQKNADSAKLLQLVHSLKGVAYTVGAVNLGNTTKELEDALKAGEPVFIAEKSSAVLQGLNEVVAGLHDIELKMPAPASPQQFR